MLTNAFMWKMSITNDNELIPEIGYGMYCTFCVVPPVATPFFSTTPKILSGKRGAPGADILKRLTSPPS